MVNRTKIVHVINLIPSTAFPVKTVIYITVSSGLKP